MKNVLYSKRVYYQDEDPASPNRYDFPPSVWVTQEENCIILWVSNENGEYFLLGWHMFCKDTVIEWAVDLARMKYEQIRGIDHAKTTPLPEV